MNDKLNPAAAEDLSSLSALERVRLATAGKGDERKDTLDDESRVKILSPGMMVFKRFVRNKLAITGTIILVCMFLFSFVAALFSPYYQTQIFTRLEEVPQTYATVARNRDLQAFTADGSTLRGGLKAKFAFARSRHKDSFTDGKDTYGVLPLESGSYLLSRRDELFTYDPSDSAFVPQGMSEEFVQALHDAQEQGKTAFSADGTVYGLAVEGDRATVTRQEPFALMSKNEFSADEAFDEGRSLAFRAAAELALAAGQDGFEFKERRFDINRVSGDDLAEIAENGAVVGVMTPWRVVPSDRSKAVPPALVAELIRAAAGGVGEVTYAAPESDREGAENREVKYRITRGNYDFTVTAPLVKQMIDIYGAPSRAHWMGTDEKGMDQMTRLMYGGRISLMVGFVVIAIELLIGVIFGGVSGYFGGWVDLLCMRFIDLFNSIPYFPVMIITGAVMDKMNVPSTQRIFLLMVIMGLMGWTGVARIVRGQILSLREQDFMVAAEATGLSVRKRIFRHLVPNVMPLLIVQATMGLGSIIITEATLSFLGLGVKPPLASWGSIINAANNQYVMQNCWWIWLPTGFLIVLTVLGFNFVGDGLRDAYDPKMKR